MTKLIELSLLNVKCELDLGQILSVRKTKLKSKFNLMFL